MCSLHHFRSSASPRFRSAALARAPSAQGGILDLYLDGNKVYSFSTYSRNIFKGVFRHRLSAAVRFKKAGQQKLQINISRPLYTQSRGTPRWTLDDISLRLGSHAPYTHCRPVRKVGGSFDFEIEGSPSAAFGLFMSPKLAKSPIPIPGFRGALSLDPSTIILLGSGALGRGGKVFLKLPIPALSSLVGVELSFQSLQFTKLAGASLGQPNVKLVIHL
ncbi:MAG: hypothetical protein CSA62_00555 [Planctomycetota bacterium]|nr:MAG: hypothetical protein CSA62_00555 [Planctomycetota bacterium]